MWILFAVLTILVILAGVVLIWLARRTLGGLFLGLAVLFYGMMFLLLMSDKFPGVDPGFAHIAALLMAVLHSGAALAFGIVYPRVILERWHIIMLGSTGAAVAILLGFVLSSPGLFFQEGEATSIWWATFFLTSSLMFLLVLVFLGARWLNSPPGPHRIQIAWGLLPFIFVNLHHGLFDVVYPHLFALHWHWTRVYTDPPYQAVLATSFLAMLTALVLVGIAMARVIRGNPTPDERALAFVSLYLLPLTLLQVLDRTGTGIVHYYVDYVFVFLILYAVARYNLIDLDLKLKWTINRGTMAAVFIAVFFVASEAAQQFFGETLGSQYVGILAAGALVFAIAPLQSLAQRISERAMPNVQDSHAYRVERRATIYRAQVESLAADGQISVKERRALLRLQKVLGLGPGHANQIEEQIMEKMATVA